MVSESPQSIENNLTREILLNRMTNRIRQSLDLQEILTATAAEMRSFLKTDRVKVYSFQPDATGQVIAEAIHQNRLPSVMGLHFPASDIPLPAREMFVKARQRSIVSIPDQQITLSRLDFPNTTGDLTLTEVREQPIIDILKRPVDPCHVQYLTAMGVQSSLVVPVLHHQELWGLLVSHHSQPKAFSEEDLQIVQMLADQVSIALVQSHMLSQSRNKAQREALINQITTLLHAPLQIQEMLQIVLQRVVQTIQGSGGRLYLTPSDTESVRDLYVYGDQPDLSELDHAKTLEDYSFWKQLMVQSNSIPPEDIAAWANAIISNKEDEPGINRSNVDKVEAIADLYQEPQLSEVAPCFRPTQIRSMLIMPLQYGGYPIGCLTLFRNQVDTNILWAGRHDDDQRNNRVRDSFTAWRELKLGQAQKWFEDDIELVHSLGTHLTMAVMQNRLYQCEREQRLLVEMRNQQLNTARMTAEEANRLKSNFLSSTSHELRTPLASTLNYLKLLKEGFYDDEVELKEYIGIAYQSTENLVAILNDVLDIAKIEAGRMNVNLEPVNLSEMLAEQEALFKPQSRRQGIPLLIDCEVESAEADRVKLRQVLTNLLSNAFKFTSAGEIRVRAIHRTTSQPPIVEISVADTGIGVDAEKRDLLFEPFVQADGSIKRRYGGTGLGLTVCKRLMELMNGQIWLESSGREQGTRVTFTLPSAFGLTSEELPEEQPREEN